jgi:hypothetical protein
MTTARATSNPKPPPARRPVEMEWVSNMPNAKQQFLRCYVRLPLGWEVSEEFSSYYPAIYTIHREGAELCRTNRWKLASQFKIHDQNDELIGWGHYTSDDPHDRALSDCAICQIEWEYRGRTFFPVIIREGGPEYVPDEFEAVIKAARQLHQKEKAAARPPALISQEMKDEIADNLDDVRIVVRRKDGTTRVERLRFAQSDQDRSTPQ